MGRPGICPRIKHILASGALLLYMSMLGLIHMALLVTIVNAVAVLVNAYLLSNYGLVF